MRSFSEFLKDQMEEGLDFLPASANITSAQADKIKDLVRGGAEVFKKGNFFKGSPTNGQDAFILRDIKKRFFAIVLPDGTVEKSDKLVKPKDWRWKGMDVFDEWGNVTFAESKDTSLENFGKNVEIRSQKHEMWAEGSFDEEPSVKEIKKYLESRGYTSSQIDVWYDKFQGLWKFDCNISPLKEPPKEKPSLKDIKRLDGEIKEGDWVIRKGGRTGNWSAAEWLEVNQVHKVEVRGSGIKMADLAGAGEKINRPVDSLIKIDNSQGIFKSGDVVPGSSRPLWSAEDFEKAFKNNERHT